MKIKVIRPFRIKGKAIAEGKVIEVSDPLARELISYNKAVQFDEKAKSEKAAKKDEGSSEDEEEKSE